MCEAVYMLYDPDHDGAYQIFASASWCAQELMRHGGGEGDLDAIIATLDGGDVARCGEGYSAWSAFKRYVTQDGERED